MRIKAEGKYKIVVMVFFCTLVFIALWVAMKPKQDNESVVYIKQEFSKIKPIENATPCENFLGKKYLYAIISEYYTSELTEEEIIVYYHEELKKHEWKFVHKKNEKDLYGVLPGNSYYFKKGADDKYSVVIFFPSKEFFGGDELKYKFLVSIMRD